jgi:siroheme synthase-like protein
MTPAGRPYPVTLDLRGRRCAVIGGGAVAARKVAGLRAAGAVVRVVAPEFHPDLLAAAEADPAVELLRAPYRTGHLDGCRLAFAATADPAVNARVASDAAAAGVLCCVSGATDDGSPMGDFTLPAVWAAPEGPLTLAVDTGGAAPALSARLRDLLAESLPAVYAVLTAELHRLRAAVKGRVADAGRRRELLRRLCSDEALRQLTEGGREAFRVWAEGLIVGQVSDLTGGEERAAE